MKILHLLQAGFIMLLLLSAAFADKLIKNPVISEKLTLGAGIILMVLVIKFQHTDSSNKETSQKSLNC
ncbi:hypothetical protein [Leeuwenhoekiella nanhaiensis]|uniref:Gliding motility protein GldL n=1 Tax=Leeuwenhoekiella nanhaiensis TaxID=1655491 RepID=A0A2G1VSZ0_9FLAO|nr:hypothetical protein [Leeuwenhoekiella nanhaiensis]PHQ29898.1 hypothetical protein CJ305_07975 [Leeuwenhoekiella nanhaiensis]